MKIYGQGVKIRSSRLDREEEVVEMLRSGKWRISSSPEGCAPGYSQLLLRRARGSGEGGHAIKLGIYLDEEIRGIKERLRSKAEIRSK
jgi:hypothetical protein